MREPVFLEEVTSTNDYLAAVDDKEPFFSVVAFSQSGGKGSKGRAFSSPRGGLYMSVYMEPDVEVLPVLTPLVAVAVRRAIRTIFSIEVGIKWVNDLYWRGKKICGILTESKTDESCRTVVGIGVNVFRSETGYDGFEDVAGWLFDTPMEKEAIIRLANGIITELQRVLSNRKSAMEEYGNNMILTGKKVFYTDGKKDGEYLVKGVDNLGRILLEKDGVTVAAYDGEVTWQK